jgi:hypothetical protein
MQRSAGPALVLLIVLRRPAAFVLAPFGAGVDSYRVWETLLLGSYPVVVSSALDCQVRLRCRATAAEG